MACQIGIWLSKPYRSLIQGAFDVGVGPSSIEVTWRLDFLGFGISVASIVSTHPHMQRGVATCSRYTRGTTSWDWNLRRTLQQGIWRSCIAWASQCFVWSSVVTGLEIDGSWSYSRTYLVQTCDVFLVLHHSARFCHSSLGHIVMFKHSWLFETGNVGILRGIDAALYMESELMSSILNRFPWDVVYQDSAAALQALHWMFRDPYFGGRQAKQVTRCNK